MNQMLIPGNKAGTFTIAATGEEVQLLKYREDDIVDSVYLASGAITAGKKLEFFTNPTVKGLQHANLTTARRISSDSEMIINRIGVLPAQAFGNTLANGDDVLKTSYAGVLTFKIGRERVITEGALVKYPTGLGVTGQMTTSDRSLLSIGVPSLAAAPQLLVPQKINDKDDLHSYITFPDNDWMTGTSAMPTLVGAMVWTIYVHGLITDPLR